MPRGRIRPSADGHPWKPMSVTGEWNWRRNGIRTKRSRAAKLSGKKAPPLSWSKIVCACCWTISAAWVTRARRRRCAICCAGDLPRLETVDKDHGRVETRSAQASQDVSGWPATAAFPTRRASRASKSLVRTVTRTEWRGKLGEETRSFISSAALTPERAADAVRANRNSLPCPAGRTAMLSFCRKSARPGHDAMRSKLWTAAAGNVTSPS